MKKVCIIGAGLGAGSITEDARKALAESSVVLGAERLLGDYGSFIQGKRCEAKYAADDVLAAVEAAGTSEEAGRDAAVAVLVSGDPGFYSASLKICKAFEGREDCEVQVVPGISSLNAMFAAIKLPWQDAALCSMHGKDANAAEYVRRNRLTFFLTGKNTAQLSEKLCAAGFEDIKLHVGEDLGSPQQKVTTCTAAELAQKQCSSLTVVVAENPHADAAVYCGIDDDHFVRGKVPMTKSEVRAVLMSKLCIRPDMVCADIGAGTGSCTVEMALAAWNGKVYAIDPNPEAVALIKENCRQFHIGNAEAREGLAPEDIKDFRLRWRLSRPSA